MRIVCEHARVTSEIAEAIRKPEVRWLFDITKGSEYVVLALSVCVDHQAWGTGVYYHIAGDGGQWLTVPALLFRVSDSAVPSDWQMQVKTHGHIRLWPSEFLEYEHWMDGVTDGEPEALALMADVSARYDTLRDEDGP